MKIITTWTWAAALAVVLSVAGSAQESQPASDGEELEAVVVAIKGVVDVKRPGDADWVAAAVDMKLPKRSDICTSYGASATLQFPNNIRVEVKGMTQARVGSLAKKDQDLKAEFSLKHGAAEIEVQKSDIKTDMKVAMPNSTTSVSGSRAMVYAWARNPHRYVMIRSFTGRWANRLRSGREAVVDGSGKLSGDQRGGGDLMQLWLIDEALNFGLSEDELYDPTGTAPANTDPTFGGNTPYEDASTESSPASERQDTGGEGGTPLPGPPSHP